MGVFALPSRNQLLHETAGRILLGELEAGQLPPARQHELLAFLRKGKLILFSVDPSKPESASRLLFPNLHTPVLESELEAERRRCDSQRGGLLEAQACLENAGIPMLLFKSSGPYPYTSSNVDALIPDAEMERAVRLLEGIGHHEMTHYWEPNKRLLRKFVGCECQVMIHLHGRIGWLVLAFSDIDAVWSNARRSSDPHVLHPAPAHLVAALLAHSVYESKAVTLGDLWKVREAAGHPEFDWSEVVRIADLRRWLPGLALSRHWYAAAELAVFGGSTLADPSFLADLPPVPRRDALLVDRTAQGSFPLTLRTRITARYFFRKLLRDNRRTRLQKTHDLIGVAEQIGLGRLRLRYRPTSLISLCGIDGSGKSTHAERLRQILDECEIPNRTLWLRGGYSPVVSWLKQRLRRASGNLPSVDDDQGKTRVYRQTRTRILWSWLVAAEQISQSLLTVFLHRLLGRTLITERYIPDTIADLSERFDDPSFPRSWPATAMRWLSPRPDLVIFLDIPADVAFSRKSDDFSQEILARRREIYSNLLELIPRVEIFDAERTLETLFEEIRDRALRCVFGRIRRLNPLSRRNRNAWE